MSLVISSSIQLYPARKSQRSAELSFKKFPGPKFIPFETMQISPRVAIKEKKTDQTQLMIGVPAYPYAHKDEYVLEVLATILGGGMSSRLFLEVRKKRGLAYSVHPKNNRLDM